MRILMRCMLLVLDLVGVPRLLSRLDFCDGKMEFGVCNWELGLGLCHSGLFWALGMGSRSQAVSGSSVPIVSYRTNRASSGILLV